MRYKLSPARTVYNTQPPGGPHWEPARTGVLVGCGVSVTDAVGRLVTVDCFWVVGLTSGVAVAVADGVDLLVSVT